MIVLRWDSTRRVPVVDERIRARRELRIQYLSMGMDTSDLGSSSDEGDEDDERRPGVTYREVPDCKASSVPLILPLSEEMRKPGPGPNKAMTAAILRALKPYLGGPRASANDKEEEVMEESGRARGSNKVPVKKKVEASSSSTPPIPAPKLYTSVLSVRPSHYV